MVILIPVTIAACLIMKIIEHDRGCYHACQLCHNYFALIALFQALSISRHIFTILTLFLAFGALSYPLIFLYALP